jgi:hypothetical protein
MLARKPAETVVTNLRIKEWLRHALEREAEKHRVSLNREMERRLEDSLQADTERDLAAINADMETNWLRFGERFLVRELEEGILTALEARDYELARKHAIALRRTQADAARKRAEKMEGSES